MIEQQSKLFEITCLYLKNRSTGIPKFIVYRSTVRI